MYKSTKVRETKTHKFKKKNQNPLNCYFYQSLITKKWILIMSSNFTDKLLKVTVKLIVNENLLQYKFH